MALRLLAPLPRTGLPLASPGFLQSLALPISITVPPLLADLWDSVLRAVPKKKTSHMKKRHRQMAGKALKDVKNLCKCPSCGQIKRTHVLCPHCVRGTCVRARSLTAQMSNSDVFYLVHETASSDGSLGMRGNREANQFTEIKESWKSTETA